jgi:indole-3-glycerol phosphate synthase
MTFVKTDTVLDKILAQKALELRAAYWDDDDQRPDTALMAQVEHNARTAPPPRDFAGALRRETVALIAEVKHASPSKGVLVDPFDPVALGTTYADNGAACISVLTDEQFFRGSLGDLRAVREAVGVPVLRKDFIIDALQVYEARAAGADAALLIVAALDDPTLARLHGEITGLGMAALVEVHNEGELARALNAGATLIGVNNRDLRTFHEDLSVTERLAALLPDGVTLVAESAIRSTEDVRRMGACGARAVLVGEGLVKAGNIAAQVREFSSQPRGGS